MPVSNALSLRDVRVSASGRSVLAGLSLDVPEGEAVALLGESGLRESGWDHSGPATALRAAGGLTDIVAGTVFADGLEVTRRPPHRRRLPLIGAGPAPLGSATAAAAVRSTARGADIRPVLAACLQPEEHAMPVADLSPAARRRVALAQAVATAPACLLVAEPGSGLAPDEAETLFGALRRVREGGVAMLIATADPVTAFALAERGVALSGGMARQAGWLRDLHDSPADDATASLLGPINRLPGQVVSEEDDIVTVRLECGPLVEARREDAAVGTACVVCVRPGRIAMASVAADALGPGALAGRVRELRFQADIVRLTLDVGTARGQPPAILMVARPAILPLAVKAGDTVAVGWQPHHAMAYRPSQDR